MAAQSETGPHDLSNLQGDGQPPHLCLHPNGGPAVQGQQTATDYSMDHAAHVAGDSEPHEGQPTAKRRRQEQEHAASISPDVPSTQRAQEPSPEPENGNHGLGVGGGEASMDEDEPAAAAADHKRPKQLLAIVYQNRQGSSRPGSKSRSRGNSRATSSIDGSDSDARDTRSSSDSSSSREMSTEENVVLERRVSEERYKRDEQALKNMPELACICEFLFLFRKVLRLQTPVTFPSLLDALITSPGPGMLQQLHTELLRAVVSTKFLDEHTWAHYLAHKLHAKWPMPWLQASGKGQGNEDSDDSEESFQPEKHHQLLAYAALPAQDRVLALKGLCDLRLERDDLRNMTHDSAVAAAAGKDAAGSNTAGSSKPPLAGRTSRAAAAAAAAEEEQAVLPGELLRRQPIGVDGSKFTYYWLDWCEGHVEGGMDMGFLLAREAPATQPKSAASVPSKRTGKKEPRHRYQLPPLPVAGAWEAAASTLDELEAFAAKLNRSMRKEDRAVAQHISGVLVAELKSRIEDQERWRKARERTRKMLGLDVGLAVGGSGRSQRQRKTVNYGSEAFDKMMTKAIRAQGGKDSSDDEPVASKRKGKAVSSTMEGDQEPTGRRGRSRGSNQDLIALDMAAPRRPAQPKSKQEEEQTEPAVQPEAEPAQAEDQLPEQEQQQQQQQPGQEEGAGQTAVSQQEAAVDAAANDVVGYDA